MIISTHYTTEQARETIRAVHLSGGLTPDEYHQLDDAIRTVEQAQTVGVGMPGYELAHAGYPAVYRPSRHSITAHATRRDVALPAPTWR
ncbi:MAG: hypothetical protein JOY61_08745 [Chloroflexi bacterium]|nr:hypothetical protein [Chloroflexota bacterium]